MAKPTDDEPKPKRKAKVQKTQFGTQARVQVADDDATRDTVHESIETFIDQAIRRWKMAAGAEKYNREQGLIDVLMVDGEGQWDQQVRTMRQAEGRPCITVNRLRSMLSYVNNQQRQARVGVKIVPNGGGADIEDARIRQGIIRFIQNDSHAEVVLDTAFEQMLMKGWSWIRAVSEYDSESSFNQSVKIEGFANDFSVYCDPSAIHPTRRDMDWGFVCQDIPRGKYVSLHPKSKAASLTQMYGGGDTAWEWLTPDHVRVAEYYYADYEPAKLYQLADGTGIFEDELKGGEIFDVDKEGKPKTRMSRRRTIKWGKINAVEILEGNEDRTEGRNLKCSWIPLIMLAGREIVIRGQRRLSGMVRNAREVQQMYNYWISAFTEAIAIAPKSPYLIEVDQLSEFKPIWDEANRKNWPYLVYKAKTVDGQLVGPPQRQFAEPPVGAIIQAIQQADNDLKAIFSIYDAALGKRGPQESGLAINARKVESESANMDWLDNMRRSVQHLGEVLLDLIPTRYDGARVVTIVRPDSEREEVLINQMFQDQSGNSVHYDMQKGKYSCTVEAGIAYATKRQEDAEMLRDLFIAQPQLFPILGDIFFDLLDIEKRELAVERLKKMLPPQLQDQEDGQEIPPQLQAQIQGMMQELQQLQQALQEAQQTIDSKQIESASKERIAQIQVQAQMAIASAKMDSAEDIKNLETEFKRMAEFVKINIAQIKRPQPQLVQ